MALPSVHPSALPSSSAPSSVRWSLLGASNLRSPSPQPAARQSECPSAAAPLATAVPASASAAAAGPTAAAAASAAASAVPKLNLTSAAVRVPTATTTTATATTSKARSAASCASAPAELVPLPRAYEASGPRTHSLDMPQRRRPSALAIGTRRISDEPLSTSLPTSSLRRRFSVRAGDSQQRGKGRRRVGGHTAG